MRLPFAGFLLFLVAAMMGGQSLAQAEQDGIAGARILEGWRDRDGAHVAAIRIDLDPGWHTYWRVPGDAGIPPQFDWSASANLASLTYEWPRPEIFEQAGMTYFGFEDALVLPVRLVPRDPSQPIQARVSLFLGVCKDICLPGTAELSASLKTNATETAMATAEIRSALRERALTPAEAGLSQVSCTLSPTADGMELMAEMVFEKPPEQSQETLIESSDPGLWIGHPRSALEGNRLVAQADVGSGTNGSVLVDRDDLRLTILDSSRAVDVRGCKLRG
jgi:DsbC/DsbD-like thiol-disulfide interchange protein